MKKITNIYKNQLDEVFKEIFLIKVLVNGLNWLYSFCQLVMTSSEIPQIQTRHPIGQDHEIE